MGINKELPLYLIKDIIKLLCLDLNRKKISSEDELYENNKTIVNLALVNWEFFKTLSNNLTTIQDFNFIPESYYPTNPMSEDNVSRIKNQDKSDLSIYRLENIKLLIIDSINYATNSSEKEIEISNFLNGAISKCTSLNSIYIDLGAHKNGYSNSSMEFLNRLKVNENVSIEINNLKLLKLDSALPKNVNKIGALIIDKIDPKLYKINNLKNGDTFIKIDSLRIQGIISDFNWRELILMRNDLFPIYKDIEELKVDHIDLSSLLSLLLLTPNIKKLTVTFCFDSLMKKLNLTSKQIPSCPCNNVIETNHFTLKNNVETNWNALITSSALPNLESLSIVDRCSDIMNEVKRCYKLVEDYSNRNPIEDQEELEKQFDQDLKNLEEYSLILELVSCFKNLKQFDIKSINSIKPILSLIKSNKSIKNYKIVFLIYSFNNKNEKYIQLLDKECRNNNIIESLVIDQEFYSDIEDRSDYTYNNIFNFKK
ncbi:hypothetical protein ACTFIV_005215 [Dictyostelium citrinum]